jgi:hypothetical protein
MRVMAASTLRHVFGDRTLADVDTELEQLIMDPRSAPEAPSRGVVSTMI